MTDGVEFARASGGARAEEARRLRHEVRAWLGGLDLDGEDRDRVVAAVSEAVENAVTHAYVHSPSGDGTVELTLWTEPDAVNVSVVDHGHWRPEHEDTDLGGRGIVLMHRSVDSVAIRHTDRGTVVALRHHLHREAGAGGDRP